MPSSPELHGLMTTRSKSEMSQVIFYRVVYHTNSLNCKNKGIAPDSFWQKITMQFSVFNSDRLAYAFISTDVTSSTPPAPAPILNFSFASAIY